MTMLDCDIVRVRANHILLMRNTVKILGVLLAPVDQATATSLRDPNDGARGWTTLEATCHLRDYDEIFCRRVQMMLAQEYPMLPGYDHEQLAVQRAYNQQNLRAVYAGLLTSRTRFAALFAGLTEPQWQRAGVHPERGRFTLYDALFQVGQHDAVHMEQIGRILNQTRAD
jgi:hypothetical protein